jgi:flagellar hook-basal body complex protein FliE
MTIPGLDLAIKTASAATPAAITPGTTSTSTSSSGSTGGGSFSDALGRLVDSVDDNASQANEAVGQMLNKTGDVHDAMIALQRAEMSLQLTVQIRNKVVQAYQDIMRMPI